jgi:hypothetical protein
VRYNNRAPWPGPAAGAGFTLERIDPAGYGNEPRNWHCGTPGGSPGKLPAPATSTLVARGGAWRYHAAGRDLGSAWRAAAYRDNAWPDGRAPLGFGADVATVLPNLPPRPLATLLRAEFALAGEPASLAALTAEFNYNDGFIAFLNGQEILQRSLPAGAGIGTPAEQHTHGVFETVDLTAFKSLLVPGRNVLAIQWHLAGESDTDAFFDAALTAAMAPAADTDRDGMPDDWEQANGLDPADPADAGRDDDGDGFSNLQEYLAGTDPRDPASRAVTGVLEPAANGWRLAFPSVPGRLYTVYWSPDLERWFEIAVDLPGDGQPITVDDPAETPGRRFYKLEIRPQ